jgi:pimeloyl-ACP methyl ester carboxylesterase
VIPTVHRRGSGEPTLVCHPGGPGFSSRFFGDLAGLVDDLELVLVDPRGTGGTPRPDDGSYAIADYVSDLEELRADLGLERISLLGYSHGGVVAMAYAARHPRRVERLILLATLARFDAEQEEAMRAAMEERSGEPWYADAVAALEAEQAGGDFSDDELTELCDREFPLYFDRFGERERAFLESVHETVNAEALNRWNTREFTTFDLRPELGRVEAPTLVLAGGRDFICGPASAREIAAAIPGATLAVIEGAGHFVHVERPDALREEVLRFLR